MPQKCLKCLQIPIVIINQQYTKGEIHFINEIKHDIHLEQWFKSGKSYFDQENLLLIVEIFLSRI